MFENGSIPRTVKHPWLNCEPRVSSETIEGVHGACNARGIGGINVAFARTAETFSVCYREISLSAWIFARATRVTRDRNGRRLRFARGSESRFRAPGITFPRLEITFEHPTRRALNRMHGVSDVIIEIA